MTAAQIQALREYAEGIDHTGTFENCWEANDYQETLDDCNGDVAHAKRILKAVAEVWADRKADADYYRSQS